MEEISNITKQTLTNLSNSNIDATPKAYEIEFCKVANNINLSIDECKYFKYALSQLSDDELKQQKDKKIESLYDLIDILLQRIEKKNIDKMSHLVQQSLKPSISLSISEDLESFSIKIGDSPSLLFEKSIQQEMEKFIEERFEVDKRIVARKTADIARLVTLMSKYLGDAIDSNKHGSSNVSNIKGEIESISVAGSTREELNKLQSKLVQAAITIENEMDAVNKNLESGKSKVSDLEDKIKQLESDLVQSKKESSTDHLTGLLTRRAYDIEIEKFEENYTREGQDYAIVFFDLDHFKKVNDDYGHDCGDVVLRTFAQILLKLTRKTDIVGRYGGEEFVAAIRYHDEEELLKYLRRIKSLVTTNKFKYKDLKLHITFSAGVDLRSKHDNYLDTMQQTDLLLYNAKDEGRDQIHLASGIVI
ncbi:MAG: diguanylate cyclase [Arcobacteraceae bacterium]|nr:diguanylate cyclase [Arcobacteraceae bacterium]